MARAVIRGRSCPSRQAAGRLIAGRRADDGAPPSFEVEAELRSLPDIPDQAYLAFALPPP
jgi:hypothetical protein